MRLPNNGEQMSSDKKVESLTTVSQKIREFFKPETKPTYSAWNPYAKKPFINCFGVEIKDDEYYINEIIGIDELPYEEFIKEDEEKPNE